MELHKSSIVIPENDPAPKVTEHSGSEDEEEEEFNYGGPRCNQDKQKVLIDESSY